VKLVMTLLVRNEADIVDAQIAFHLHAGVDLVIATDNGSSDGTTEILERYARAGHVHLLREPGEDMRQPEWVTRMARLAVTDYGADWVINSDADEFWWPRGGSLKDVLSLVPERYGVVRGCWRHFLPRPTDGHSFAERMIVRLCTPAFPGEKRTIYHAHQKVAHRADPAVVIEAGNHNAIGRNLEPLRGWHPIEILHFSLRSVEQVAWKGQGGWRRLSAEDQTEHQIRLDRAYAEGRLEEFFAEYVVSDADLERGIAAGTLAVDTRLRDALRRLGDGAGGFRSPGQVEALDFSVGGLEASAAFAAEASVLAAIDAIPRAEARVAALESRITALRTLPRR
jgi:hypothetical protein